MHVDRCVCFNVTFARLNAYVESHGGSGAVTLEQLQSRFHCGRGCELCVPYIQKMLRTGETSFPLQPPGAHGGSSTSQSSP